MLRRLKSKVTSVIVIAYCYNFKHSIEALTRAEDCVESYYKRLAVGDRFNEASRDLYDYCTVTGVEIGHCQRFKTKYCLSVVTSNSFLFANRHKLYTEMRQLLGRFLYARSRTRFERA